MVETLRFGKFTRSIHVRNCTSVYFTSKYVSKERPERHSNDFARLIVDNICLLEVSHVRMEHCIRFPAYASLSDGSGEQNNRTALDNVRSLFRDPNLEHRIRCESALYSTYLSNLAPEKLRNKSTSFKPLFRRVSDPSYVRFFGCKEHIYAPSGAGNQ